MTPKEILERAAALIDSASDRGDEAMKLARILYELSVEASNRLADLLEDTGTRDEIKITPVSRETAPRRGPGRPRGSRNKPKADTALKTPPRPKTMSGMTTPEGETAPCEICGCRWNKPCDEGCGWSQDYMTAGRYVCTVIMCRKRAYDADVAYLMRTGNPNGYCGPVSAEQLLAEKQSAELKN